MAIGYMNIQFGDFERPLVELGASAVQIIGRFESGLEQILINVEVVSPSSQFEEEARQRLIDKVNELAHSIKSKKVEVKVVSHSIGSLPRNPRTGKLKTMIDERFKA
jgi:phenylacetate-coenzyme A ligase PaaK-like adenylate-forming protein